MRGACLGDMPADRSRCLAPEIGVSLSTLGILGSGVVDQCDCQQFEGLLQSLLA